MAEEPLAADPPFSKLPDHVLIEIFVRVPIVEWAHLTCVNKHWANLFRDDCLWHAALIRCFPLSGQGQRWPGPIPRGISKRRFVALYMSKCILTLDDDEINQFIACGKSRDRAHELATLIWLAVIDNFEDNHQTFVLLKRLALEGEVFLPYPYSRSYKVEWKIFERLLTDFRDCLHDMDYYDLLACAKQKFQPIPATWLGY
ncbi:hypothetical protein PHJA_000064800 [Phtheirospermum japonicum]|uniref:F-box domain-containing protein n=1 Tax=Phtheirospermum japonicum TaxID=374723 RepID=A0A830B3G4_9LAMI|nr:hypothetical protein PHJA_000064800 [Phtheirospermum japonicum]